MERKSKIEKMNEKRSGEKSWKNVYHISHISYELPFVLAPVEVVHHWKFRSIPHAQCLKIQDQHHIIMIIIIIIRGTRGRAPGIFCNDVISILKKAAANSYIRQMPVILSNNYLMYIVFFL